MCYLQSAIKQRMPVHSRVAKGAEELREESEATGILEYI